MFPYFILTAILCLLLPGSAFGQGQTNTIVGLANTTYNDPWLVWLQPDQLGQQSGMSASAGSWYRWNTPGAGERMIAFSAAVPGGGLAFGMQQQNFAGLRESQHLFGFGKNFSNWQLGIQMRHERQRIEERSRDRLGFGISGSYAIIHKWTLMAAYHQSPLSDQNWQRSNQQPHFRSGFSHQLSKQLQLCVSSVLQPGQKPRLQGGIIYQPLPQFLLLMGYEGAISQLAFGLNYQLKQLRTSLTAQMHPQLGTAYWIDLCFDLPAFSF